MADYHERRTVIESEPARRAGHVETEHEHVSYERHGMSGAAVAAIVLSAVAAAVLLTLLFTSDRNGRDAEIAQERLEPVQTAPAQPSPQQPVVVTVPQPPPPQTTTVQVPVPVPVPSGAQSGSQSSSPAVTDTSIEVDVISKLTNDPELRTQSINVKFNNGTATLSGLVPRESLKARAEMVAKTVKGVSRVVNEIEVQGQ